MSEVELKDMEALHDLKIREASLADISPDMEEEPLYCIDNNDDLSSTPFTVKQYFNKTIILDGVRDYLETHFGWEFDDKDGFVEDLNKALEAEGITVNSDDMG